MVVKQQDLDQFQAHKAPSHMQEIYFVLALLAEEIVSLAIEIHSICMASHPVDMHTIQQKQVHFDQFLDKHNQFKGY